MVWSGPLRIEGYHLCAGPLPLLAYKSCQEKGRVKWLVVVVVNASLQQGRIPAMVRSLLKNSGESHNTKELLTSL